MEQWESAVEMLRDPAQREATEKLYVGYETYSTETSVSKEEAGIEEDDIRFFSMKDDGEQILRTETDLGWHITKTNREQLLAVAHNATKSKLILRGKLGWRNGVELLQRYGTSCYSNIRLQTRGICLNKERFEDLSSWLKATTEASYWLADKSGGRQDDELLSALRVDNGVVGKHIMSWVDVECTVHLAIRPGAYLSQDTLLDMGDKYYDGSSPERAIRMRLGDLEEERRLKCQRQFYKTNFSYRSSLWETMRTKLN